MGTDKGWRPGAQALRQEEYKLTAVEGCLAKSIKIAVCYISLYSKWTALPALPPPASSHSLITCYVCYVHSLSIFGFCLGSQSLARAWHTGSPPLLFLRGWDDDRTSPTVFWFFSGLACVHLR